MFTKSKDKSIQYRGHHYHKRNFHNFVWCDYCSDFLWGISKQGYKCAHCKLILHSKCIEHNDHCKNIKTTRSVRKLTNDNNKMVLNHDFPLERPPDADLPPTDLPTHVINLSLPPRERFKELGRIYKEELVKVRDTLFNYVPEHLRGIAKELFHGLDATLKEYGEEIEGVADGSGLDRGELLLLNLAYELTDYCTSIVVVGPKGEVLHARNQDFEKSLRSVVIQALYVNGAGQELFKGVTFAGFLGVPTGFVSKRFSVSINAREKLHGSIFENIVAALAEKGLPSGYLVRKALERRGTFKETVDFIDTQPLIAPTFFIIAGAGENEGVVLARNRTSTDSVSFLDGRECWYLSQTNHDTWAEVPAKIDEHENHSVHRWEVARGRMEELGPSKMSLQGLNEVLCTTPVLNEFTLYTSLMCPKTDTFYSYHRMK